MGNGNGIGNGFGDKLDNFFDKKELPMYKDKPYNYAASKRTRLFPRRRRVIAGGAVALLALLYWLGAFSSNPTRAAMKIDTKSWSWPSKSTASTDWESRRQAVKEAFILSWDGYEKYAWGKLHFRNLLGREHANC